MCLKYRKDWGWWGLFIQGHVARNGEGEIRVQKGGGGVCVCEGGLVLEN